MYSCFVIWLDVPGQRVILFSELARLPNREQRSEACFVASFPFQSDQSGSKTGLPYCTICVVSSFPAQSDHLSRTADVLVYGKELAEVTCSTLVTISPSPQNSRMIKTLILDERRYNNCCAWNFSGGRFGEQPEDPSLFFKPRLNPVTQEKM